MSFTDYEIFYALSICEEEIAFIWQEKKESGHHVGYGNKNSFTTMTSKHDAGRKEKSFLLSIPVANVRVGM